MLHRKKKTPAGATRALFSKCTCRASPCFKFGMFQGVVTYIAAQMFHRTAEGKQAYVRQGHSRPRQGKDGPTTTREEDSHGDQEDGQRRANGTATTLYSSLQACRSPCQCQRERSLLNRLYHLLVQEAVKVMAKSLVRNRHAVTKMYGLKSQLQAVSLRIAVGSCRHLPLSWGLALPLSWYRQRVAMS
jgi:hypothetical protein